MHHCGPVIEPSDLVQSQSTRTELDAWMPCMLCPWTISSSPSWISEFLNSVLRLLFCISEACPPTKEAMDANLDVRDDFRDGNKGFKVPEWRDVDVLRIPDSNIDPGPIPWYPAVAKMKWGTTTWFWLLFNSVKVFVTAFFDGMETFSILFSRMEFIIRYLIGWIDRPIRAGNYFIPTISISK